MHSKVRVGAAVFVLFGENNAVLATLTSIGNDCFAEIDKISSVHISVKVIQEMKGCGTSSFSLKMVVWLLCSHILDLGTNQTELSQF